MFLAGLLAIALLFAGSLALIAWATRDGPAAPSAAPVIGGRPAILAAAPEPASAPSPTTAPAATDAVPASVSAPAGGAAAPPRAAPLARAPSAVAPARRRALGSFRREIIAGFAVLQQQVARCEPSDAAAVPGGSRWGDASFLLDLEGVAGGMRIVAAQLDSPGEASVAALSCVRTALTGQILRVPSAEPGRRWQMPFVPGQST
jgi:hypothetical protein